MSDSQLDIGSTFYFTLETANIFVASVIAIWVNEYTRWGGSEFFD